MRRGRARRPRERQSARGRTPEAEPGVAQRREPRRAVPVLGGGVHVCSPAAPSYRYRARPSVYSVSRRRPGRSTCRFHRLHRIDLEVRAAQSTDPIVYAVAPVPSRVRRESLFEPQYRTYAVRSSGSGLTNTCQYESVEMKTVPSVVPVACRGAGRCRARSPRTTRPGGRHPPAGGRQRRSGFCNRIGRSGAFRAPYRLSIMHDRC